MVLGQVKSVFSLMHWTHLAKPGSVFSWPIYIYIYISPYLWACLRTLESSSHSVQTPYIGSTSYPGYWILWHSWTFWSSDCSRIPLLYPDLSGRGQQNKLKGPLCKSPVGSKMLDSWGSKSIHQLDRCLQKCDHWSTPRASHFIW